jgi:GTPase
MKQRNDEVEVEGELPSPTRERPPRALVAIVGRPNVGKSTVFNRLVGRREAIVHDEPGVTRDRHYAPVLSLGRSYTVVDTGGFDPESDDPMRQGIARQVQVAVAEADVVVCVLDAMQGPTDADRKAVQLLRRSGRPVVFVGNKADSEKKEHEAGDLYRLGVQEILNVSALHGRGFGALEQAIVEKLPPLREGEDDQQQDEGLIRIAIVGRPNAGKSSMVNRLAGSDRVLVDARPGTTRDPVDTLVERDGMKMLLIDTAGIRRKSKVVKEQDTVEVISVLRAMRSIDACDLAVLMCDATVGATEQDAKVLGMAVEKGRAAIVVLNKIDQVEVSQHKKLEQDAREKLSFAPWAPIVRTSAVTGRGVGALLSKIGELNANFHKRVPTGEMNRFFETVLDTHPPPTMGARAPRLFYITQAEVAPPLFVVMSNAPESVHFSYQRYVTNQIRKHFGFEGVPVRVAYREKRKKKWVQKK